MGLKCNCSINTNKKANTKTAEQIAEQEKKKFYDLFFKKHYQNIVVLSAAGTSMDNGAKDKCGKTREGLWEHCQSEKYESSYEQPYFEMMSRFQQALRKEKGV